MCLGADLPVHSSDGSFVRIAAIGSYPTEGQLLSQSVIFCVRRRLTAAPITDALPKFSNIVCQMIIVVHFERLQFL